ncbi:hypothetical protein [Streptomyces sp. NBC_01233]|uniref:hypothetical protein n=1 Tax=Streptomyces sp. NBC_01233 TaxID=2903787 RepID=UPI002E15E7F6|nr:hypothetical protein OG332_45675 [Streptomyces sp. NBC_01233]
MEPSALLEVIRQDFAPGPPTVDGAQRHSRDGDRQRVLLEQWRGQWHATVWAADEAGPAARTAAVDPATHCVRATARPTRPGAVRRLLPLRAVVIPWEQPA